MEPLVQGFAAVLQPLNILYCFAGVLLGTVVGILPGLGPLATIAILLPITYKMGAAAAIIMLAGVYYGVAYGGTATSVLLRIPGEASSVITCLDGYMMARNGRAGAALGIAALGSFVAGTFGTVAISYVSAPLAALVFAFGPAEYTTLMIAALCAVTYFSGSSLPRSLLMAAFGLALGCIGADPMTMEPRLSFGSQSLAGGIELTSLAVGLFGFSELLALARKRPEALAIIRPPSGLLGFLPNREEWRRSVMPIGRGTVLGFLVGVLPGGGAVLATFLSYTLERKLSRHPEQFGRGAVEGLAGPETANNAGTAGSFVPLLCMGIPSNAVTAVLLSAFMIHGVTPGPTMIAKQPELFWTIIASMYLGNVMLVVLNVPLIGLLIRVINVSRAYLSPTILLLCVIGVYSASSDPVSIAVAVAFGFIGYFLRRHGYDLGLIVMGFVLGPILERSVRQALLISNGDVRVFVSSPLAIGLAIVSALVLIAGFWPRRPIPRLEEQT